uniref:ASXH domain-containing protein n=1 Tax=Macrostomum lignano TaxID=282301 RepID=A0A1I8H1C7_9PLAT
MPCITRNRSNLLNNNHSKSTFKKFDSKQESGVKATISSSNNNGSTNCRQLRSSRDAKLISHSQRPSQQQQQNQKHAKFSSSTTASSTSTTFSSSSNSSGSSSESCRQSHKRRRPSAKSPDATPDANSKSKSATIAAATKRRRSDEQSVGSARLLNVRSGPRSQLAKAELKALINDSTFAKLSPDAQSRLLPLFPACDVVSDSGDDKSTRSFDKEIQLKCGALSNEFLADNLADFSRRLRRCSVVTDASVQSSSISTSTSTKIEDQFVKPLAPPPVATAAMDRRRRSQR